MYYIVVLGNSDQSIMRKRVDAGSKFFLSCKPLYVENGIPEVFWAKLIFSGGSKDPSSPEALRMKEYCMETYGISEEHIMVETLSRNTYQNLMFTKELIKDWPMHHYSKIVVCTSTFHIKRSMIIAQHVFGESNRVWCIHTEETPTNQEIERERLILCNFLDTVVMERHIYNAPPVKLSY